MSDYHNSGRFEPPRREIRVPETHSQLSRHDNLRAVERERDPAFDTLLDLDGQVLVVDPAGNHWVKFVVTAVSRSPEKPHGLDYSLTLHGPSGERLVGFDNAHPVGRRTRGEPQDHKHRLKRVLPYEYRNAATLLADFWTEVDTVLRRRGVTP